MAEEYCKNSNAEMVRQLRKRMKENGFSKKDQQAIRQMTKLYRHNVANQHQHQKINWHLPEQEEQPWEWKQGRYFKWGVKIKKNQWQR